MSRAFVPILALATLAACDVAVETAKREVADQLRDPASAQFRNVTDYAGAVCGEVNSKNGFGGYAGFRRFIDISGVGDNAGLVRLEGVDSDFQGEWGRLCHVADGRPPGG